MTRALSSNNKLPVILVEFRYGDPGAPSFLRLTTWTEDVADGGHTFTSMPELDIQFGANKGSLEDNVATIRMPFSSGGFSDTVSSGEPFSPIFVTIRELLTDPTGTGDADDLTLYKGQVRRATRTAGGRPSVVALQCGTVKGMLAVPLGIVCNNQCQWTLGDLSCKIDVASLVVSATVASIVARTLNVVSISGGPYERGYVRFGGLSIGIRSRDGTALELVARPPAAWVGQTVELVPGCNKTIEMCRATYANEANFGGMGYSMPSWHPVIEGP